ncbi:antigen peptide transporter 2 isoform X2 [Thalassophryne amazonica]|nr:antigen peptide transporter 2 isoform X2 [Thalassophryne amazonica]
MIMAYPPEPYPGTSPDLTMLVLGLISSSIACVLWESYFSSRAIAKHQQKPDAWRILMRILMYFTPDIFYLIAAFIFLLLSVLCDTFIPFYEGKVIDMLRGELIQTNFLYAIGQLTLVFLGSAVFSGIRGGIFKCVLAKVNKRMQHLLFHSLLQQEVHFFEENSPGVLSAHLHSDVDKMGRTIALNANALVRSTIKTILMLALMVHLSWQLTLINCIEMLLLGLMQNKYTAWTMDLKTQIQACEARVRDLALQSVSKICTVRSFRAEEDEIKRYKEGVEQTWKTKRCADIYSVVFCLMRRLVSFGIKILLLLRAHRLISAGQLTIGGFVSFLLYQKPMSVNLRELMYSCGQTMSTVGVISKVFGYLDRKPKCKPAGDLAPAKLEGRILFDDVSFAYPSASPDKLALKSVSMELLPGKVTALVGPSGSGKTSCVSLLKRLYEPQKGQILLDGQLLNHYKHKYLHQKIALVSQNPVLFSGSVMYNITYGLDDCTVEKVKETARKFKVDGFISKLENGYNTDIGEGGVKLSEGEKQRIAIIRAMVRDPQMIILDEATSKLDIDLQHVVIPQILACGCTVLMVAHQLKAVEQADHIIFIEKGEVVEEGTHQELMAKRGHYHHLKEELFAEK